MPSLGADMDSGKLVEWKVKVGDRVKKGDIIAVVETQKSAVDVEIWHEGTLEALLVEPGEADIPVGTPLARLRVEGEEEKVREIPKQIISPQSPSPVGRPKISPAARKRAEEFNIDLTKVASSLPGGVITLEDVERTISGQTPAPGVKQLSIRQAIAAAMEKSHREIPLYYLETQFSMERALTWMEEQNRERPPPERLLYIALLLKAVALSLKEVPELNGHYLNGAFQPGPGIHLGVAVSLREGGLMAPALHDVDQKPLMQVMREALDLVKRVRTGGLRGSELTDPTLTVTSLGEEGVEKVFGLVYPPQVAIVGFGKIYPGAAVEEGKVVPRRVIAATLSADHRASDGHRGGLFLNAMNRYLQEPEKL